MDKSSSCNSSLNLLLQHIRPSGDRAQISVTVTLRKCFTSIKAFNRSG